LNGSVFGAARVQPIGEFVVLYLNRLGDALLVLARWADKKTGCEGSMLEKVTTRTRR